MNIPNPITEIEPIPVSTDPIPEEGERRYYERGEARALAMQIREETGEVKKVLPGRVCASLSKQTGLPCPQPATDGHDVCVRHGGTIEGGVGGNRPVVHMQRSKYLRTDVAEKVEEARNDPELLGFREDVLFLEARWRIFEQERKNGGFIYSLAFDEARQAYLGLKKASKDENPLKVKLYQDKLEKILNDGVSENSKDKEQEKLTEKLGRAKEREYKRMAAIGAFMAVTDVKGIMLDIQQIILDEVKEEIVLQRISERFGKYAFQRFGNKT